MTRTSILAFISPTGLILAACASGPQISTEGVNETATPRQAAAEIEALQGDEVLWGGMIVNSANLEDATRLEILGYPLDGAQRPSTSAEPTGRFMAIEQGYLETVDYRQGRLVTVRGTLTETREGSIGEADYTYPVVESDQVYLWPQETGAEDGGWGGVNFGIGIGVIF
jgi:outer membrane lipoprotein